MLTIPFDQGTAAIQPDFLIKLSGPDIPVIAAIMTLHQCFIPDQFDFGIKSEAQL